MEINNMELEEPIVEEKLINFNWLIMKVLKFIWFDFYVEKRKTHSYNYFSRNEYDDILKVN